MEKNWRNFNLVQFWSWKLANEIFVKEVISVDLEERAFD